MTAFAPTDPTRIRELMLADLLPVFNDDGRIAVLHTLLTAQS
jgi:hypothetical protein